MMTEMFYPPHVNYQSSWFKLFLCFFVCCPHFPTSTVCTSIDSWQCWLLLETKQKKTIKQIDTHRPFLRRNKRFTWCLNFVNLLYLYRVCAGWAKIRIKYTYTRARTHNIVCKFSDVCACVSVCREHFCFYWWRMNWPLHIMNTRCGVNDFWCAADDIPSYTYTSNGLA